MNRHTKTSEPQSWQEQLLFFIMLSMLVSLFLSRTALSISMIAFVSISFLHDRIKDQFINFFRSPLLWGMSLLFFLPLLSGLWSEDRSTWLRIMIIKAPLLFMPLAFAGSFSFSEKQWKWIAIFFITLVLAATGWSFFGYINNYDAINSGYLQGKSMITFLENDRVRFSWLVTIAILLCGMTLISKKTGKSEKLLLAITGAWFIVFLHLLSVRTGLISFYLLAIAFVIGYIVKQKIKTSILILVGVCFLPFAAYLFFPSFQNRVRYFRYELPFLKKASYRPGGNDITRVISLKAGWEIMNDHPLSGTGLGDLDKETARWYNDNYPGMLQRDKIAPSSEWLIYGVATGWPGFILFTIVMLLPFFITERKHFLWVLLSSITVFSFLFDIGLEVQFGVFIYTFVVLSCWNWLRSKEGEQQTLYL